MAEPTPTPTLEERLPHSLASEHFRLHYAFAGPDAASPSQVQRILDILEYSYARLVRQDGFRAPQAPDRIQVYLMGDESHVEQRQEGDRAIYLAARTEFPYESIAPHELFHVIQAEYGHQPRWILEGTAIWAEEEVYPQGNFYTMPTRVTIAYLWTGGIGDLLDEPFASAIFWVFLAEHYGGKEVIERVLLESGKEGDQDWSAVERAFSPPGKSLDDLWEEFSLALATRDFSDRRALFEPPSDLRFGSLSFRRVGHLPAPIYEWEGWAGQTLRVEQSNRPLAEVYEDPRQDPTGSPLRVKFAYGINFHRFTSSLNGPMQFSWVGATDTAFRVNLVVREGSRFRLVGRLDQGKPVIVENSFFYDEIWVVATRGREGSGFYSFTVSSPQGPG